MYCVGLRPRRAVARHREHAEQVEVPAVQARPAAVPGAQGHLQLRASAKRLLLGRPDLHLRGVDEGEERERLARGDVVAGARAAGRLASRAGSRRSSQRSRLIRGAAWKRTSSAASSRGTRRTSTASRARASRRAGRRGPRRSRSAHLRHLIAAAPVARGRPRSPRGARRGGPRAQKRPRRGVREAPALGRRDGRGLRGLAQERRLADDLPDAGVLLRRREERHDPQPEAGARAGRQRRRRAARPRRGGSRGR